MYKYLTHLNMSAFKAFEMFLAYTTYMYNRKLVENAICSKHLAQGRFYTHYSYSL